MRLHRKLILVACVTATTSLSSAQRPDSLSGLIVGQVIEAPAGRPVGGAIVSLSGPPSQAGIPHTSILTRGDGRFAFRGLRAGSYTVTATRNGYADGAYGRLRPAGPALAVTLADGERNGDVLIRIWKHAAISGTVTDESGERQVALPVRAYRRGTVGGRRRYLPAGSATTDDRGMFRIGSLIPGDYIVGTATQYMALPTATIRDFTRDARGSDAASATATAGMIPIATGNSAALLTNGEAGLAVGRGMPMPPPDAKGLLVYPPTFHPATMAGEGASVIRLRSGQEHEAADLQIAPVRSVMVSGTVTGPDGPVATTPVRLASGSTPDALIQLQWLTTQTDRNGRFTFPAVPSGHYNLLFVRGQTQLNARAGADTMIWADVPLSVGTEDVSGVAVTASPGLRLRGRLQFDGANPPRNVSGVQIVVEPVDGPSGTAVPQGARTDAAGEFTSPGVPAGRYYVRVPNSPTGWMFLSATSEGRDVTDAPLSVTEDVNSIVVTFTDRWSGIHGSLQGAVGGDSALVVVFPTDPEIWGSSGQNPRRVRGTRTTNAGAYSFNLPPGEYYVAAIPDEFAADWQDPDFMSQMSRSAARVRIGIGERKMQHVRPVVIR